LSREGDYGCILKDRTITSSLDNRMITLEQVDGLTVSEGLERCMNDRQFYRSVLLEFLSAYGDMAARLDALLAAGQWGEAESLTHAAKGTTGMLSANDLYDATTALNATLKRMRDSGEVPSRFQSELDRFRRELSRLLTGLRRLSGD
jgi:HPt (histidine-containing phosphotransfer) domain-containing protein